MITEENIQKVREMFAHGLTKTLIAKKLNLSLCDIHDILGKNRKITDEQKEEVKELHIQGLSIPEIALKMGFSWHSVNNIILNKVYTYKPLPKKTSEEIRREKEERNQRLMDLIKEEEKVYPSELDKSLAEIRYRDNHIEPPKTIIK